MTTALIVVVVSELSRRYSLWAAVLASLPLTSMLAFLWIYSESKDTTKIIELSYSIFWLVIPSLAFFLILPALLKQGVAFGWAMLLAAVIMVGLYSGTLWFQKIIA